MKRSFDIVVSACALVVLLVPIAVVAAAIRTLMGRPVLYREHRPGWGGRPFTLLKFRTMTNERDDAGSLLPDEARLTWFGRFLRAWSLDELPQLLNVLRGDMSLIGPRPLLTEYLERYTPEQARRHEVRPGITGWAQVNGRNDLSWDERLALDVWYVDNRSVRLDLRIAWLTLGRVASRRGISAPGHATMPRFGGGDQH